MSAENVMEAYSQLSVKEKKKFDERYAALLDFRRKMAQAMQEIFSGMRKQKKGKKR